MGQGSEILDPRPVYPAAERDESSHVVPGHSFDTTVQQQHAQD